MNTANAKTEAKKRLTLERTWDAPLKDVWELWTTKDGLESWWGPEGFTTEVRKLELRKGGAWHYAMTATGPGQVEFMKRAGMPLTNESRVTYTEVAPMTRLAYRHHADFIPGVTPYDVDTTVELREEGGRVKMTVTFDAMHDAVWTERARMGHEQQLAKLDRVLAERRR